jgi:hypothetical protein
MEIYPEDFEEDAVSDAEALGASARFVAIAAGKAVAFRLDDGSEPGLGQLSKDEILFFLGERLEAGDVVHLGQPALTPGA